MAALTGTAQLTYRAACVTPSRAMPGRTRARAMPGGPLNLVCVIL